MEERWARTEELSHATQEDDTKAEKSDILLRGPPEPEKDEELPTVVARCSAAAVTPEPPPLNPFDGLPDAVAARVCHFLDSERELGRLAQTSRRFSSIDGAVPDPRLGAPPNASWISVVEHELYRRVASVAVTVTRQRTEYRGPREVFDGTIDKWQAGPIGTTLRCHFARRPIGSFEKIGLSELLLRGIYEYGLLGPSQVQQRATRPLVLGRDVAVQCHSGTGKTAAYICGALQRLDVEDRRTQAVILVPTRELALGIRKVFEALGKHLKCQCIALVGCNRSHREVMYRLERGVHVVVGTPGRVFDMINRRALFSDAVKLFVLDEADEILRRGFKDQVYSVFYFMPRCQVGLFSVTMPQEVVQVMDLFMHNPVQIHVEREELQLEGVKQFYIQVDREEWKLDFLCDLWEEICHIPCIVYVNTRRKVDWLVDKIQQSDFDSVSCMHGEMEQKERDLIMRDFRRGSFRFLVTTDLSDPHIFDLRMVFLVINYDLPTHHEKYIHRIGHCGICGRKGLAINFLTQADIGPMREIEQFYSTTVEEMPMNIADLI
eukprot:COSAG01_NODE_130_length_24912_cov_83.574175_14_plen_549_part_00